MTNSIRLSIALLLLVPASLQAFVLERRSQSSLHRFPSVTAAVQALPGRQSSAIRTTPLPPTTAALVARRDRCCSQQLFCSRQKHSQAFHFRKSRRKSALPAVASSSDDNKENDFIDDDSTTQTTGSSSKLDEFLSTCTSAFPLFVLGSAILGVTRPSTLLWVNGGSIISIMLAAVMCGTGLTLKPKDFLQVWDQNWSSVPLGVACQFLIMPLLAFTIGKIMLLPIPNVGNSLFLGLVLVGCSPGGTASNLVALIARANVALSVILTACSTFLAVVLTPTLVKLLVQSQVRVDGWLMCQTTSRIVLAPVLLGMLLNSKAPRFSQWVSRFTPFASVLIVSLICGGVVAQSAPLVMSSGSSSSLLARVSVSVFALHATGFALGYLVPSRLFGKPKDSSRTISIEVGMQNSALAVVLARSIGAPDIAGLPGALSATAHSCLGSILGAIWRLQEANASSDTEELEGGSTTGKETV
mmetsp:Transcript_14921/g.19535  ORF Transcript_14921/g.19535 Transcript_14921/m.19535 type:complete len:471 (-) Transcript_14921:52-1464(-)